jgi:23S rRNA pseudouridine2605 synthase
MEKKRRPRIIKPNAEFSTEHLKDTPEHEDQREFGHKDPPGDLEGHDRPTPIQGDKEQVRAHPIGQDTDRREIRKDEPQPRRPYEQREGERRPWQDRDARPNDSDRPRRPYEQREGERRPWQDRDARPYDSDRPRRPYEQREGERRPWQDRDARPANSDRPRRPYEQREGERRPYERREGGFAGGRDQKGGGFKKPFGKKPFKKKEDFYVERKPKPGLPSGEGMPLNKYLAHCGLASRRKAVDFISESKVTVNGEVKNEPFYRVQKGDVIVCDGQLMHVQERMVYILLNKPKGVITTTEDEHGRATVLDIVDPHFPERVYPVGRLDRDTTGLLLITNDGDLAQKLAHPSHQIKKHYRATLDKPLRQSDYDTLENGLELEDGVVPVNWIRFSEDHPERDVVELEIVIGRNRVVRRMFEALGYRVRKLDRFYYAGLTKRELPRGSFRELTQKEVVLLKHFSGNPPAPPIKNRDADLLEEEDN